MAWRVSVYVLGALLLGAHFLRDGNWVAMGLSLCAPLLLFHRKRWVLVLLQVLAYGAAATWLSVGVHLVDARQQAGRSWTLALAIMVAVALVTLAAGLLLNSGPIKDRYPR